MDIDFDYDINGGKRVALNSNVWTDDENDDANNSDSIDDNGINIWIMTMMIMLAVTVCDSSNWTDINIAWTVIRTLT